MTRITALVVIVGSLAAYAPPAAAVSLASHRAIYQLDLARVRDSNSGVAGVGGRIVLEAHDDCNGFTFRQRIRTEMAMLDGAPVISDIRLSTWETHDGMSYQFAVKQEINGQVVESFRGTASLSAPGEAGQVRYVEPPDRVDPLPRGTLFPMTHTGAIVAAAEAGQTRLQAMVFDGAAEDGLSMVNAVIGARRPGEQGLGGPLAALDGRPSWPARLAYFKPDRDAELAEFEVGFRLYDNGVATDIELDYGDIVIHGTLTGLEIYPAPVC